MASKDHNSGDAAALRQRIRTQAATRQMRLTQHAHQEMVAENIALDGLLDALAVGEIIENYPVHRRGACCLLHGMTRAGRNLHVVCTSAQPMLIIITVYEPKPPKWLTPRKRRQSR